MAANFKTINKVIKILDEELDQEQLRNILRRLYNETVPSGNSSYDETIQRLVGASRG